MFGIFKKGNSTSARADILTLSSGFGFVLSSYSENTVRNFVETLRDCFEQGRGRGPPMCFNKEQFSKYIQWCEA